MKKQGWQGASNVMVGSMEKSIDIALNIVVYHLARLYAHRNDGDIQMAMYTDFLVYATEFINMVASLTGDKEAQTVLTESFESEFMEMSPKLDSFDSLTREVHDVNTEPYKLIWGRTRDRFYMGSYELRLAALLALATEMTAQAVPDGAAAVLAYRTSIISKHDNQKSRMDKVGVESNSADALRHILIKKLNKNRGGLIYTYGDDDDCQAKVNKFYPLNLMGDRSHWGHYQLLVPHAEFRKICIHSFKEGEKIEIFADGCDVWISMADNAYFPITSGYKAINQQSVIIEPALLGNLDKKFIIVTNANLTGTCDLIFNIIKPKA